MASQDEASSEEGEISVRDSWRHPSPPRDRPSESRRKVEVDIDSMPPSYQELNEATLNRYELVEMMYKDQFEEVIKSKLPAWGMLMRRCVCPHSCGDGRTGATKVPRPSHYW